MLGKPTNNQQTNYVVDHDYHCKMNDTYYMLILTSTVKIT